MVRSASGAPFQRSLVMKVGDPGGALRSALRIANNNAPSHKLTTASQSRIDLGTRGPRRLKPASP